jgi:hypothetical protein
MKGKSVFHSSCSFRCFLLSFFSTLFFLSLHISFLLFPSVLTSGPLSSSFYSISLILSSLLFSLRWFIGYFTECSEEMDPFGNQTQCVERLSAVQNGDEKNQLFPWYVGETSQSFHLHPGQPMTQLDLQAPSSSPWPSAARHVNTTQLVSWWPSENDKDWHDIPNHSA